MQLQQYKLMFRHMPEMFFNEGDLSLVDQEIEQNFVDHVLPPQYPPGVPGLRQFVSEFRAGMPDVHYDVDHLTSNDLVGEENRVVQRLLASGTHTGTLFGIPASGRRVLWTEIHIGRYEGGKLVEHWGNVDVLGIFQQMGVVPAPAGAGQSAPTPQPPAPASATPTSPDENKALMRRFIEEVWNKGNLQVADEIFHPAATSPSAPQLPPGPAGVRIIAEMFRSAFPDFRMTIEDLIAEEDIVVARFTQGGTHRGTFMGAAPTGRQVQFTEIGILRVAGGKVVESWYETDMLSLYQQVGLIPQQT
jgi:predicted ester cyclase